jgi:hypothetical protein
MGEGGLSFPPFFLSFVYMTKAVTHKKGTGSSELTCIIIQTCCQACAAAALSHLKAVILPLE